MNHALTRRFDLGSEGFLLPPRPLVVLFSADYRGTARGFTPEVAGHSNLKCIAIYI